MLEVYIKNNKKRLTEIEKIYTLKARAECEYIFLWLLGQKAAQTVGSGEAVDMRDKQSVCVISRHMSHRYTREIIRYTREAIR